MKNLLEDAFLVELHLNHHSKKKINKYNTIAKLIKICGISIIIIGTILSFIIAGGNGYKYEFSFIRFLTPELTSIISGLLFIGFSEIIQLLKDIKNKLK